jgi:hypothetical protein
MSVLEPKVKTNIELSNYLKMELRSEFENSAVFLFSKNYIKIA